MLVHMLRFVNLNRYILIILTTFFLSNLFAQEIQPQKVGYWENVQSFAISQTEDYIVLSVSVFGKNQLYETRLENGVWTELKAIDAINNAYGEGFDVEGPSLNFNSKILYFHANFPDTKGGFDIYYSERGEEGWGKPISIGSPINTPYNEMFPSITPGESRFFFSRMINEEDVKKPKETPQCQAIFVSLKTPNQTWGEPTWLHDGINRGCEYSSSVCNDGKTLFFSSIDPENYKESYNLYFTREILQGNWLIPMKVESASSENTNVNPVYVNQQVYFLQKWRNRKVEYGSIYKVSVPANYCPSKTFTSTGKIVSNVEGKPLKAKLTVFEPTTLQVLGTFYSDEKTGVFEMPLLDGYNYIVDVRKHGYSFASFMIDYRDANKKHAPEKIELFQNIDLIISVYDNEIFKPLDAEVIVENAQQIGQTYQGKMVEPGIYAFSLPVGTEYIVSASASWFNEDSFKLDIAGDVIFSQFERNLPLTPKKRSFDIQIADSETEEGVAAEVLIRNLNRDETIIFSAEDVKNGKVTAMLREGDEYEFTIRGAQGYSFHNQVVDMGEEDSKALTAELVPLKEETSIRLNNINFGTNSADLSSESFPELDRVITLMKDNPSIIIEISAHSDNVGSKWYNQNLSEKRAQSVLNYLIDFEVPKGRIVAKGYGMSKPMVPNTSEENRALNRRVEFKIIDITEENVENEI